MCAHLEIPAALIALEVSINSPLDLRVCFKTKQHGEGAAEQGEKLSQPLLCGL